MDTLMNSIDDIKGKLTDMEYKTLCDQMAVIHKEKSKLIGYCELKFTRVVIRQGIDEGDAMFSYYTTIQTLVVKMDTDYDENDSSSTISTIQRRIAEEGDFPLCLQSLGAIVGTPCKAEKIWNEYCGGHLLVGTEEHYRYDEDGEQSLTVEAHGLYLKRSTCCALISFKIL